MKTWGPEGGGRDERGYVSYARGTLSMSAMPGGRRVCRYQEQVRRLDREPRALPAACAETDPHPTPNERGDYQEMR